MFERAVHDVRILTSVLERNQIRTFMEILEGNERRCLWGEHMNWGGIVLHGDKGKMGTAVKDD